MRLRVGDRVKYSVRFLRSISALTGDMPQARGTIKGLRPMGSHTLAHIHWDYWTDDTPPRVNVVNLARADDPEHSTY